MILDLIFILLGVVGLYYGGRYLVDGAVGLSLHFGIPPMIVGLTVMAFGTSAPELIVSLRSALSGHGDIAFGNVVGSNIANILLIFGVPAIISALRTDTVDSRIPWMETMFASFLLLFLVQFDPFTTWQGLVLLACFLFVIFNQVRRALKGEENPVAASGVDESKGQVPLHTIWFWIAIGVLLLPIAAEVLVRGAIDIARTFGLSEAFIGLTIVAIGTSLPELAASVVSAAKGETEMVVGNVFGSCLFNILLILGVTAVFSSTHIDPYLVKTGIPVMVGTVVFMAIFVLGKRPISRAWGVGMVGFYFAYLGSYLV